MTQGLSSLWSAGPSLPAVISALLNWLPLVRQPAKASAYPRTVDPLYIACYIYIPHLLDTSSPTPNMKSPLGRLVILAFDP